MECGAGLVVSQRREAERAGDGGPDQDRGRRFRGRELMWCVESALIGPGGRVGTAKVIVATRARAEEIASQGPGRSVRPATEEEIARSRAAQEKSRAVDA